MPDAHHEGDAGGPPRFPRRPPALGLALPGLLLALVLTGCSVEMVRPGSASSAPQAGGEESAGANQADQSADPDVTESEDPLQYARRSYYADKITATLDCANGEVVVDKSDQTVRITRDCAKVIIRAEYTDLLAEHVDSLLVEEAGEFSYVLLRSADTVVVAAEGTDVWWDEGNPTVDVAGFGSVANPNPVKE
ncbi:MAG: hypothetical protein KJ753_09490 [Actinobacteria bacterium]|nr:hypothetical protein [Actinomycetota bacterium]